MTVAIVCVSLLGVLVFGLGFYVSLGRGSTSTNYGYDPDPTDALYQRVRAHGNAIEYAPMLAVLMLYLGLSDPEAWVLWTMGITTAARYLHAIGMMVGATLAKPQPLRFAGALLTYVGGLVLCFAAILTI